MPEFLWDIPDRLDGEEACSICMAFFESEKPEANVGRRRVRPKLAELTGDEFNELNATHEPALNPARQFDAFWLSGAERGDHVAALASGIAAAGCRAAVHGLHEAWFMHRKMMLALGDFDEPRTATHQDSSSRPGETAAQVLDRLVAQILETNDETTERLTRALPRFGQRSLRERLTQLRDCEEWLNPNGILHDHPAEGCAVLFRTLLLSPVVHAEIQDDLMEVRSLRRDARRFRDKIRAFDSHIQSGGGAPFLPQLASDESERFRDALDTICAGDVRTRHKREGADRVAIVRAIADHFRRFLNVTREAAADMFRVDPWSTGFASLAHAALNREVSTEDVRGALKDWTSD